MRHLAILLLLFFVGMAEPARAEYVSGNNLLDWCSTARSSQLYYQDSSSCREFVVGVHDGVEAAMTLVSRYAELENPIEVLCVPSGVTAGQLAEIVTNYLRANPENRHESANYLVILALMEAYPCRRAG